MTRRHSVRSGSARRRAGVARSVNGASPDIRTPQPGAGMEEVPGTWGVGDVHYEIEGGVPLRGEVRLSSAKNAVTKLMAASLLTEDRCMVRNAPRELGDVTITERVLRSLGTDVSWPKDE